DALGRWPRPRPPTWRSLPDPREAVATVCGPLDNGRPPEHQPLLRKASLTNRVARRRLDSDYIEFYKKWRSLENVADDKERAKLPRFAIRSWLIGIFGTRSSDSSLRRAPPYSSLR
ncbi:unnamed protein product, partial [Leptidea sinapis]